MAKLVGANRYENATKLGSGAFGVVYIVRDKEDRTEYVMKKIQVGALKPDETFDALREAKLLYQLSHPNIVRYRDSFLDGDCFCIITEFCRGGDLHQRIQDTKKAGELMHEDDAMDWFTQLTMAIHYMHERRILHRDLKSSNVFLTHDNIVKLGDLGIAKVLMGTIDSASTFTGTPYYMSPEVLKNEAYNSKSDIWSMGCILYELCCLERPFEGRSLIGLMFKICDEPSPNVGEDFSDDVHDLIQCMLSKDPTKRPSAAEILAMTSIRSRIGSTLQRQNTIDLSKHRNMIARECAKKEGRLVSEPVRDEKPMTPAELLRMRKLARADQEAARRAEEAKRSAVEGQSVAKQRMQQQMQHSPYRYDDSPARPKSAARDRPTSAKKTPATPAQQSGSNAGGGGGGGVGGGVNRLKGALMADAERQGDLDASFSKGARAAAQRDFDEVSSSVAYSVTSSEKERPLPTSSKFSKAREARRAKQQATNFKQDTVESGSDSGDDLVLSVTGGGKSNAKGGVAGANAAAKKRRIGCGSCQKRVVWRSVSASVCAS
eukprot:Opistho-2@46545